MPLCSASCSQGQENRPPWWVGDLLQLPRPWGHVPTFLRSSLSHQTPGGDPPAPESRAAARQPPLHGASEGGLEWVLGSSDLGRLAKPGYPCRAQKGTPSPERCPAFTPGPKHRLPAQGRFSQEPQHPHPERGSGSYIPGLLWLWLLFVSK